MLATPMRVTVDEKLPWGAWRTLFARKTGTFKRFIVYGLRFSVYNRCRVCKPKTENRFVLGCKSKSFAKAHFLSLLCLCWINSFFIGFCLLTTLCSAQTWAQRSAPIQTGAMQTTLYMPTLQGKRVGMVVNHTSTIGKTHLVDSLLAKGVTIKTIFAPEHGFRGQATDGEESALGVIRERAS